MTSALAQKGFRHEAFRPSISKTETSETPTKRPAFSPGRHAGKSSARRASDTAGLCAWIIHRAPEPAAGLWHNPRPAGAGAAGLAGGSGAFRAHRAGARERAGRTDLGKGGRRL
jgi:hypothetical protein